MNQNRKIENYEIFKIFILIYIYLCTVIKIKILINNYEYFSIIYILLNFIILFLIGKISYKFNLVDFQIKEKFIIKQLLIQGGCALSVIYLFSIILFDSFNPNLSLILSIGFLISIVGFIDDKYNLNIGGKLSLQIIPIFYLIFFENFSLNKLEIMVFLSLDLGSFFNTIYFFISIF